MRAIAGLLLLVALGSMTAHARRVPWRKGARFTFRAPGGQHAIQIVLLGDPNTGPCQASLREGKKVIWDRRWPSTPGAVTVAQGGQYACALNYSNWDEHWYRSVSFYGSKGELLKEIEFYPRGKDPTKDDRHPRSCELEKTTATVRFMKGNDSYVAYYALPAGTLIRETKAAR